MKKNRNAIGVPVFLFVRFLTFEKAAEPLTLRPFRVGIIPLREIIGNYNPLAMKLNILEIIPLREIIGNYNKTGKGDAGSPIIPLREIIGNYNRASRHLSKNRLYP